MLSEFVREVNKSFLGFLFSGNRNVEIPITISVQPRKGEVIWNLETGKLVTSELIPTFKTHTQKIGKNSISFIVPNIRFNDANLAGEGRVLNIELELPNGTIKLEAIGEQYERVGKRTSLASYLIVAKISYITPLAQEIYEEFLRRVEKKGLPKQENLVFGITQR